MVVDAQLSDIFLFLYVELVLYLCLISDLMIASERYKDR